MEKSTEGPNELDPEKDLLPKNDKWKTVPEKKANAHYPLGHGEEYLQQQEKMQEGHERNIARAISEGRHDIIEPNLSAEREYQGGQAPDEDPIDEPSESDT